MPWTIRFEDEFEGEFLALQTEVQDQLLAGARLLADYGPRLGRPYVDTLNRVEARQHEGASVRCCERSLESGIRFRSAPTGHSARRRR